MHSNRVISRTNALKAAKGLERQRYSKRLHEDGVEPEKKERLEREVTSLDLHQTARAHLYSSILKVKDLAASTDLPEEIRTGVPKPELTPEEQAALHNVTSALYNRELVKQAITRAITTFCQALDVPLPGKAKRVRKSKKEDKEEQPPDRIEEEPKAEAISAKEDVRASIEKEDEVEEEESEFQGFSDHDDPVHEPEELDSEDEAQEEKSMSKYDHLLGGSSDSEDEDDFDDEKFERFKGKEKVNLDDISVSGSDAAPELGSESEEEDDDDDEEELSVSASPSPPPAKKKKSKDKATASARPRESTFLPTLMGGYISGSESASDVDVAPAKKRRGQRARQAIWEKKFGNKAKHLQKPAWETQRGRDSGWDGKRGAVEPGDGPRTPWKKGIRNPLAARQGGSAGAESKPEVKRPPPKKDDEGPLHPSWAARKQAKDAEKTAAFAGSKITFD
ncbi:bud22 family [Fusarium pseudoanthophilum]|uniref:Bud22 family n=1 Tax=Fusarium pseudoanthophilum TaxID=48495 RepID=A0A8H5PXV6_9HYPO|nr:bud22 family [Fusarium pseudoanthophilum]